VEGGSGQSWSEPSHVRREASVPDPGRGSKHFFIPSNDRYGFTQQFNGRCGKGGPADRGVIMDSSIFKDHLRLKLVNTPTLPPIQVYEFVHSA
jgi:hypothetical protein